MSPRYQTALFDFDGTLASTFDRWMTAFHLAFQRVGVNVAMEESTRTVLHRDFSDIAADIGCSEAAIRDHTWGALAETLVGTVLFDGIATVIDGCRAAGIRTGVVTSAPRAPVSMVLDANGLLDRFEVIVGADDVARLKPAAEPIERALAHLGVAPDSAVMIGDTSADVLSGRAAGVSTALYLPSTMEWESLDRLRSLGADHEYHAPIELLDVLGLVAESEGAGARAAAGFAVGAFRRSGAGGD